MDITPYGYLTLCMLKGDIMNKTVSLYMSLYGLYLNLCLVSKKYKGKINELTDLEMKTCRGKSCHNCGLNTYTRFGTTGCLGVRLKQDIGRC